MEFRTVQFEVLESTNVEVKHAIEAGEPEGLVVRARRQMGGYGRQGRTWESPEGGLYLSVLLRPNVLVSELPALSLVAGVAVRDALSSLVTSDQARLIQVKWPNDVVVAECCESYCIRKLAGISLELHKGGVCLGVGVNVEPPLSPVRVAGKNAPAYMADLGYGFMCDRRALADDVACAVLREFDVAYNRWLQEGFTTFKRDYDERSFLRGQHVCVTDMAGKVTAEGKALGVDAQGRLLVEADGAVIFVSSGEAHIAAIGSLRF